VRRKWWRNPSFLVAVVLVAVLAWNQNRLNNASSKVFGHDLRASQLSVPLEPTNDGPHAFLNVDSHGRPLRFDPCHIIHYVVHVGDGPVNGVAIVQQGVDDVSRATGLTFHYDGTTDKMVSVGRAPHLGDPVWIGWATKSETQAFADATGNSPDAVGVGGPIEATQGNGRRQYVGGSVVLLPTDEVGPGFGPGATEGNVLLHELGHLVGLAHVNDSDEIMNPSTSSLSPNGYNVGDLEGLGLLGASQGCL
jgi:hypothetical protein